MHAAGSGRTRKEDEVARPRQMVPICRKKPDHDSTICWIDFIDGWGLSVGIDTLGETRAARAHHRRAKERSTVPESRRRRSREISRAPDLLISWPAPYSLSWRIRCPILPPGTLESKPNT